jgi:hypothetical protein
VSAQDWYHHANVHDGSNSQLRRTSPKSIVALRLIPQFLQTGINSESTALKMPFGACSTLQNYARTRAQFDPKKSLQQLDTSTSSSALLSLAAGTAKQINETEDVTAMTFDSSDAAYSV